MNPHLARLNPYPFERLRALVGGEPAEINLSIGEPKHPTPSFIKEALVAALDGLAVYPATVGTPELREAIAGWLVRRYGIPAPEVLPVNGSREALFSLAQTVVSPGGRVVCPNPFYQIYEGAALLAGATPVYGDPENWQGVQLVYACSPANPTGKVMSLEEWRRLFELSDRHGFVIAADECYSEIYFGRAPLGALQAAHQLKRGFERLVVLSSLSKRSNVPGMRSGFVAGDPAILDKFRLYRTYHGSAMSLAIQKASIAAWNDEAHVRENRALYKAKFAAVLPMLAHPWPDGAFYVWLRTPIADTQFVRRLRDEYNVLVLPGSYLGREVNGHNPGANHVRIALVAPLEACVEAARRIRQLIQKL